MAYTASMDRSHKPRSGICHGGIGAGWFELRHDGCVHQWNAFNNQPLGTGERFTWAPHQVLFVVVRIEVEGEPPRLRLLQIEGSHGSAAIDKHEYHYIFPWITGVDRIEYEATFPFTRLSYHDRDMPLEIELEAYSPFIPRDVKHSSLPACVLRFHVRSRCPRPVEVTLIASLRDCVAYDVPGHAHAARWVEGDGFNAFEMTAQGVDPAHSSMGTMGIGSLDGEASHYLGWEHLHPYWERTLRGKDLANIDDTPGRNSRDPATGAVTGGMERCWSSIARRWRFERDGDEGSHRFAVAWHFPNLYAQQERIAGEAGYLEDATSMGAAGGPAKRAAAPAHVEGHYYANFFKDSTEVIAYLAAHERDLHARTTAFHRAFHAADAPPWLLDAINAQLNTFVASSWLTKDMDFGILEGLSPDQSYAGLDTTDVAMYGAVATAALFPELDRRMVQAHQRFQQPNGVIAHSIMKNFRVVDAGEASGHRLDMPAQYACMALRAAFWADDRAFLRGIWPSVQAALEYVLRERDHNRDLLPDMQGVMCSYDNFPMYGAAPYVASQWLAAARAAEEAARILGDAKAEARWREVVAKGSATLEAQAWNGGYYRISADPGGKGNDEGCLSDQIIGRWAGHLIGLPVMDPARARQALLAVMAMNWRPDQGLRNCQWPGDVWLHDVDANCWVDQANTCWTGVEYAFASFLIYEGLVDEGLRVARNVEERHRRWGMAFDHQEFGGHYYRPMSAWAIVNALAGFSARNGVYRFAPALGGDRGTLFLAWADGWGHLRWQRGGGASVAIDVGDGALILRELILPGLPTAARVSIDGATVTARIETADGGVRVVFAAPVTVTRQVVVLA